MTKDEKFEYIPCMIMDHTFIHQVTQEEFSSPEEAIAYAKKLGVEDNRIVIQPKIKP